MRADRDLRFLAEVLKKHAAVREIDGWLQHARMAARYLWNDDIGAYTARDLRTGEKADGVSSVAFLSYYAGIASSRRDAKLQRTLDRILDSSPFGIPSFDPAHPKFDSRRYWRGPSWAIINYLVARGLAEFGFERKAERIRMMTRDAIKLSGFSEYFDPITGAGYGGKRFTWTAAIWLAWASPKTDPIAEKTVA